MQHIVEQIKDANAQQPLLAIGGKNQPNVIHRDTTLIDTTSLSGIIDYQPDELFIRLYAGTPISEVDALLKKKQQFLANTPPILSDTSTIGGMIAGNLSSWGRLGYGSVKDQILGLGFINGLGEYLEFGGQVMKNVAGFDASRLMAGSQGAYGVIHDVSLKVLPIPNENHTFVVKKEHVNQALTFANDSQRHPINIIGAAFYAGELFFKINGSEKACELAQNIIGGERLVDAAIWQQLENYSHPIFNENKSLWRVNCSPLANIDISGDVLYDWGGALRFIATEEDDEFVINAISKAGASAKKWQGENRGIQTPVASINQKYIKRLKLAFDPKNLFDASNLPCT